MSNLFDKKASIRHIAVPSAGENLFATGEFKSHVAVWSFQTRRLIFDLATILDFGGTRLGLIGHHHPIVITGSWTKGVTAYMNMDKQVLWSRQELKNIQEVRDLSHDKCLLVGVGLDAGSYYVLKAETGEDQVKLPNIKKVYASYFAPWYLLESSKKTVCLSSGFQLPPIWERPLVSFAILHAAFSPVEVVYSEANGSVYCIDFLGTEMWRFNPGQGHHVMSIRWDARNQRWLAIEWNYERGGPKLLLEIDQSGRSHVVADIGPCLEIEFFPLANYLITSHGTVVSTQSGETVWRFLA